MDGPEERAVSQVVVVGASAGGIEALSSLVAALPADFPAPVVIAQHLDPHVPSRLGSILAARGPLPVKTVNTEEPLAPGVIYVVPSGHHVEITDHLVRVLAETGDRPQPSVNRLLETAARALADNLIAVILTGFGTDGSEGALVVKAMGGTVIVENPETAAFPGMPGEVPSSAIDIVANLDAIGPLLVDLVSGRYIVPGPDEQEDLEALLARVRGRSGLDFGAYKRPTIERRLQRRMAAVGTPTVTDYRRYLERHPEELQRLVASFLIKVTQFFRDPELFTYLRDNVLPGLIAEARERGELRVWSAGCATGEEPYTLAMLIAGLLEGEAEDLRVRIFATDAAADAIDYARRGVYPEEALIDMPTELVDQNFVRVDGRYEVRKSLRQMVVFGDHDLGHRAPFPRTDLVLCRNVLIYFTSDLQRRVLERFAFSLRQGGYLVLGKSETVSPLPEFFALEQPRLKVFRRAGTTIPIPAGQLLDDALARPSRLAFERRGERLRHRNLVPTSSGSEEVVSAPSANLLLEDLPVGVITVDQQYDIRSLNMAARRLLGLHGATVGNDLVHRVPSALAQPLRTALDVAFRGETTTLLHETPEDILDDGSRHLRMTCFPARRTSTDTDPTTVVITIDDVTESTRRARELEREAARAARATVEVRELRQAAETMAAEVARLRAENEGLQLANEEAQAAAEEIETLNEEAQAANEELETLNEELQATVEELGTANEELQARGTELQVLAAAQEEEWKRLEAVLTAIGDAVLVVDGERRQVLTNAAYQRTFDQDIAFVPEDETGAPLPTEARPQARAARGEAFSTTFTIRGAGGTRRWYEATGQPLERDGSPFGGVLTIRDITERSLRQLQDQWLATASHELRTPLAALQVLVQLAERQTDPARIPQMLTHARQQIRRIAALVSELVDASRLQYDRLQIQHQRVDLGDVVRLAVETAQLLANGQAIELTCESAPLWVDGDMDRLEQVVLNLLTNAITYAPGTERIDVRLRHEGCEAVIEVEDRGPGVPEEDLERIFSRYFRAVRPDTDAQSGLGLGLFIAREIVTAHGGTISVCSPEGAGSIFTVRLPLIDDAGAGADA